MDVHDVKEVAERLSPLFDIAADGGTYPLSEHDRFVPEALASQMREVTGRDEIRDVVLLSRAVLLQERSRPTFFPLHADPSFTRPMAMPRAVAADAGTILVAAIQEHLLRGCVDAMYRSLRCREGFAAIAMQNVFQLVYAYCTAALVGNRLRMEQLDMPVAFLGSIIPLGTKADDPSTFLYLRG